MSPRRMVAKMSSSSASFASGSRQRGNEGRKLQVGPVELGQRAHAHQRKRAAADPVDVLAVELQVLD